MYAQTFEPEVRRAIEAINVAGADVHVTLIDWEAEADIVVLRPVDLGRAAGNATVPCEASDPDLPC